MSLQPLLEASLIIQLHALAAVLAFLIGGWVLFSEKGNATHKTFGRIWSGLMVVVAATSFFIWQIRLVGPFSPIHLLSIWALFSLFKAIQMARLGRIKVHKSAMQQLYLGALIIAGFFTFMPGRIMHKVIFGDGGADGIQWAMFLTAFTAIILVGFLILRRRMGWRLPRQTQSHDHG